MLLPEPSQKWVHSCTSVKSLRAALADISITAVEADIVMGHYVADMESINKSAQLPLEPVMAHPPQKYSDLRFEDFLAQCIEDKERHVKLDFKSMEAVRQCMPVVASFMSRAEANGQTIFLNGDILPGPGTRAGQNGLLDADDFMQLCREHCESAVLSLSWLVKLPTCLPYTDGHVQDMVQLLEKYDISSNQTVFAVNARCVDLDVAPLQRLLENSEQSQLLFWTATGEPGLSTTLYERLQAQFDGYNVGFDVQLARSSFEGFLYDTGMWIYALYLYYTNQ